MRLRSMLLIELASSRSGSLRPGSDDEGGLEGLGCHGPSRASEGWGV